MLKHRVAFHRVWSTEHGTLLDCLPKNNPDEENLSAAAFDVMTLCWKIDPKERPHMHELQARYQELQAAQQVMGSTQNLEGALEKLSVS